MSGWNAPAGVMAEYAPDAITAAWEQIHAAIPSAQLSGIQGDAAHTYGYHRGRDYVANPNTDYSTQLADDKKGNGQACSALDVTMGDADMAAVTQRLIDATLAGHPGLIGLRSFLGTTDGRTVIGMDCRGLYYITSDPTHLWHEHFSGIRLYADDDAAWSDIAAIATGESGDDMWKQTRLVASPDHPTVIDEAGVWVPLSWDSWSPDDGSGGTSCVLPPAARLFISTVDVKLDVLPLDQTVKFRVQTLDRSGNQLAVYRIADVTGNPGSVDLSYSRVGSVGDSTNLRMLVAATQPLTVLQAEWRVLHQ